jgi:hypothetical protein
MIGPGRYILYCRTCGDVRVHEIQPPSHRKHALLATVTFGLWLPAWVVAVFRGRRPRCRGCGSKRSLPRLPSPVTNRQRKARPQGSRHLHPAA